MNVSQRYSIMKLFTYLLRYLIEKIRLSHRKTHGSFNVHGSVHRNNILVYKSQQDVQVKEFI